MRKDPRVEQVRAACGVAMVRLGQAEGLLTDASRTLRAADTPDGSPEEILRRWLIAVRNDVFAARQTIVEKSDDYYEEREQ